MAGNGGNDSLCGGVDVCRGCVRFGMSEVGSVRDSENVNGEGGGLEMDRGVA